MNIHQATQSYENWMRSCTSVIEAHLRLKHKQMRESSFLFFRGTFYRWAQLWPDVCASLRDAPKVLAVGDLHVGSFGARRDTEGRLSWGVDDFDESYPLPYTNDLVRLAASVKIVIDSEKLTIGFKEGCSAILEGYQKTLKAGGCPFVLAEHEKNLASPRNKRPVCDRGNAPVYWCAWVGWYWETAARHRRPRSILGGTICFYSEST